MKRYLYIILVAAIALVSCNPPIIVETRPDIVYYFGAVEINTTSGSARVKAFMPYVTIDGEQEEGTVIYMEYWAHGSEDEVTKVESYTAEGENIIFEIENLEPSTAYRGVIAISGKYGEERSDVFPFTTKEHIPVCSMSCNCAVEPHGVFAEVEFTDVAYLVDGQQQDIIRVKLEYARSSSDKWIECSFTADVIVGGVFNQVVPLGDDILEENRYYKLRLTLQPKNDEFEPITSKEYSFKTIFAEITADVATPELEIAGNTLTAAVDSATVWFDGREVKEHIDLEYGFIYRMSGQEQWSDLIESDYTENGMSIVMDIVNFQQGATYEFCGVVVAGAMHEMRTSNIAQIEIPNSSTPPSPPVSGDADTQALAGDWHLAMWRGAEPGFDVYLSITQDGVVSLFQRIESRLWSTYFSTVAYENGVISGVYTDGVAWGDTYYVALEGDEMTWTSTSDSADISVYRRCTLPDMTNPEIRVVSESGKRFL